MAEQAHVERTVKPGGKVGWTISVLILLTLGVGLVLCYGRRIPPPPPRVVRFLKPKTNPPPVRVEAKIADNWEPVEPAVQPPFTGWFLISAEASHVRVAISLDGNPGFDDPEDLKLPEQTVPRDYLEYVVGLSSPGQDPVHHAVGEWVYAKDAYDLDWDLLRHDVTIK